LLTSALTIQKKYVSPFQTLKQGLFEFYTGFEGTHLADGANSINMCIINQDQFDFLYLIDLDGSFRPNTSTIPTLSTLVASDNHEHLKFLDKSKCSDNALGCYSYCQDTCFRSMRYYVEGADQANYMLKVCSRNDHELCTLFKGGRRGDVGAHEFTAHLPAGKLYDAVFLDALGREITPTTVREVVELTFCTEGVFEVTLFGKLLPSPPVSLNAVSPVNVPSPAQTQAKAPAPIPAPVRAPIPVPVRAPIPAPVVRAPVRVPVRPPVVAPVKVPVRVPVRAPIAALVQSPTAKAPVGKKVMSMLRKMLV
jgi:hypothetical protein